jgi:hypothetical protein
MKGRQLRTRVAFDLSFGRRVNRWVVRTVNPIGDLAPAAADTPSLGVLA